MMKVCENEGCRRLEEKNLKRTKCIKCGGKLIKLPLTIDQTQKAHIGESLTIFSTPLIMVAICRKMISTHAGRII